MQSWLACLLLFLLLLTPGVWADPFGHNKGSRRTQSPSQHPTRPCNPHQDHYYQAGPTGRSYRAGRSWNVRQYPRAQGNYRDWGQTPASSSLSDDVLPSYRNSSSSSARLPGY